MLADEVEINAVLAPKASMYDQLLSGKNAQDMNTVAKAFGYGRNKLFAFLREKKVLMHTNLHLG